MSAHGQRLRGARPMCIHTHTGGRPGSSGLPAYQQRWRRAHALPRRPGPRRPPARLTLDPGGMS
eukprot:2171264-Alexandrium_andersonii.AAC.1